MEHVCWQVQPDRGFLIRPEPLGRVSDALAADSPVPVADLLALEALAADLSRLVAQGEVRRTLDALPTFDFSGLRGTSPLCDSLILARLQQVYTFLANAYVYAPGQPTADRLPAGVAVPLVQLSRQVERPPILAYCDYVLANWQRIDPTGPIVVENLRLNQSFLNLPDESWFARVHVEVEAKAAVALGGLMSGIAAAQNQDEAGLIAALDTMRTGLRAMIHAFNRMTDGCDPDTYYFQVRPYIFGFTDVVYEGVDAFGGAPQRYRGASGAQSSVVPALVAGLGISHERSSLMQHLDVMKAYMPAPHRQFIAAMQDSPVRAAVQARGAGTPLADAYNTCLRELMGFRKLHFHFASLYIFQRSQDPPLGTGGTDFMRWLPLLIDETERHLI
jgi:indoleamine 2,3-dioxygenase